MAFASSPVLKKWLSSRVLSIILAFGLLMTALPGYSDSTTVAPAADQAVPAQSATQVQTADERIAETLKLPYHEQFSKVLGEAMAFLDKQGKCRCKHHKQGVVFDLDETLLDNRAYFVIHKKYDTALWDLWLEEATAPGIPEAVAFYQALRQKGYRTYFVSGRKEKYRQATIDNLKRVGITDFDGIYLKPDRFTGGSASNFKVAARQDIESKGVKVLLILGDQESDLTGGYGTGFKLPNPIYTVP